jgi:tetratricopeptide (TPR) repeat protein
VPDGTASAGLRYAAGLLLSAVFILACYQSARIVWADVLFRHNSPASVDCAVRLDPGNARYHAWRAELLSFDGQDPVAELKQSLKLNPRDSAVWIRLAAHAENSGDPAAAERFLQKAAEVDKLFTPRWALMNFYFRQGDARQFWAWTTESLRMSYGDLRPLFELCWRMTDDAGAIERAIPATHTILGKYLAFLMGENRLEAAGPVARRFLKQAAPEDTPLLLSYCDRLLEQARIPAALPVWNGLCDRRLLPYPGLAPERGRLVTNGDFAHTPLERGFDWHGPAVDGVHMARAGEALQLTFTGKQPERCRVLWQPVPLAPRTLYRLRFEYRTTGMTAPGAGWDVASRLLPPSEEWRAEETLFTSGDTAGGQLALVYQRLPATMRFQGTFALRRVRLDVAR